MTQIPNITAFAQYVERRLNDDWDLLLPIYGDVGSGKSYAAYVLGHALDPTFTWDRHEFSGQTYVEQMDTLPPTTAGVWDEIVEGGLRMRTTAEAEVNTLKKFIVNRAQRQIHLICVPEDSLMLKFLAKQRPDWRVLVNRDVGWDYSVLEIEEFVKWYDRWKDKWDYMWITRLRYVLRGALLETPGWDHYLQKKDDWAHRLGRDAAAAMDERTTSEHRDTINDYKDRLQHIPNKLHEYHTAFLEPPQGEGNNGVGLTDPEKHVLPLIEETTNAEKKDATTTKTG